MEYHVREKIKNEGWDLYNNKRNPVQKRAHGLLDGVIRAHYWRAREALDNGSRPRTKLRRILGIRYTSSSELSMSDYANHWLFSNGDRYDKYVIDYIKETHGYFEEESQYMPKGHSYYKFD